VIALGIRYLTRYAVATDPSRERPEWPQHPGRVFMAMAAAHFETGSDPSERAALEWLEAAPPPALRASDADERTSVRAYVPVNDDHGGILRRARQERAFPRVRPHDECMYLIWPTTPGCETRAALSRLCAKVTRVGHSMSAVQMWVLPESDKPEPNWLPASMGKDARLRVAATGTLRSLETAFNGAAIRQYYTLSDGVDASKGREKVGLKRELQAKFPTGPPVSARPQLVSWQGYEKASKIATDLPAADGPFDENFLVLTRTEGAALGLESTLKLTRAIRNAAMKAAGTRVPEWLSGHDSAGAPSLNPHLAFFPLPYVGFEFADGHVMGLGIAVPRNIPTIECATRDEELRRFLGPLLFDADTGEERAVLLWEKESWRWLLERETRERPPLTLQRMNWTEPSRTWASVTPVVLHHHPRKREGDLERIVKEAFVSALFPEPESVIVRSVSALEGAGHAMAVPLFTEGGTNLCRYQTHVVARFGQPVRGPMLVGRGRFRGYGLFRPVAVCGASQ
jgi:CRISPR-associated protein Csb2